LYQTVADEEKWKNAHNRLEILTFLDVPELP
jgi:hypothetical protein